MVREIKKIESMPKPNVKPRSAKAKRRKANVEGQADTAHERAGVTADDHRVPQQEKPVEEKPKRSVENEAIRSAQTLGWDYAASEEYAPTSHTSNRMTRKVLDPMPHVGAETDHSNVVSGSAVVVRSEVSCVPVRKQEWKYDQPKTKIKQTEVEWRRPV